MESSPITMVVADELTLIREGLAQLCRIAPDCEVIAQCADGAGALELIQRLNPRLALLDLNLGVMHALEVVHRVRQTKSQTRFVILSTRRDRKTALECLRAGVNGYVLKSGPVEHLLTAIQYCLNGAVYISPLVAMDGLEGQPRPDTDPFETLSSREHQVFSMLIEGVRAKEIAARLDVSPKTVDSYRAGVMRKLDIHNLAGLVKFAIERELTPLRT